MRKVVCWHDFLCFVNKLHERVFQGARSIRHVDLKTGSDSVTLANSKICWYDRPHASEFAAYSKICTLKTVLGKKMWIQIFPDMCRQGLKVTTVFFFRFQKVIFKCFFLTKMRTPRSNKRLRCTKNNNNKKETQWNGRFSRTLRRPSSKCNTSPSHLKQLRQSLIIYSNKSLWSYQAHRHIIFLNIIWGIILIAVVYLSALPFSGSTVMSMIVIKTRRNETVESNV